MYKERQRRYVIPLNDLMLLNVLNTGRLVNILANRSPCAAGEAQKGDIILLASVTNR